MRIRQAQGRGFCTFESASSIDIEKTLCVGFWSASPPQAFCAVPGKLCNFLLHLVTLVIKCSRPVESMVLIE